MAAGDTTDAGPYSVPLSSGAKTAIKALRTSANDHWLVVYEEGKLYVINIEEA